jgi:uncharacterized phiE125 gp8 family phage protein
MALRRVQDATEEPISVAEAKEQCNYTNTDRDAYFAVLISAARKECEARVQRAFIDQIWERTLDEFPEAFHLYMPPVIGVESLRFIDEDGVQQLLDPSDYYVDKDSEPGYVVPATGKVWPTTHADSINTVKLQYRVGYGSDAASVPEPIRQAIKILVEAMFNQKSISEVNGTVNALLQDFVLYT